MLDEHVAYLMNLQRECLFKEIRIKTNFQSWECVLNQKMNKLPSHHSLSNLKGEGVMEIG